MNKNWKCQPFPSCWIRFHMFRRPCVPTWFTQGSMKLHVSFSSFQAMSSSCMYKEISPTWISLKHGHLGKEFSLPTFAHPGSSFVTNLFVKSLKVNIICSPWPKWKAQEAPKWYQRQHRTVALPCATQAVRDRGGFPGHPFAAAWSRWAVVIDTEKCSAIGSIHLQ